MAYSDAWRQYVTAGWSPFPVEGKGTDGGLPTGVTGRNGKLSEDKMSGWAMSPRWGVANTALRLEGVVGIDVDDYVKGGVTKTGAADLDELSRRFGPLPATYSSTSRGAGPSRISFYRLADPTVTLKGKPAPSIEVIQRHHRYAVVWPSEHPDTARRYEWYNADMSPCGVPNVSDLALLPAAWEQGLAANQVALNKAADIKPAQVLVSSFATGEPCLVVQAYVADIETCDSASHISHDDFLRLYGRGLMLGREGHPGVSVALDDLADRFGGYLDNAGRPRSELRSMVESGATYAQQKYVDPAEQHAEKCLEVPTKALQPAGDWQFFNGDRETGHRPHEVAAAVAQGVDLIRAPGGRWLRFDAGRWVADGEEWAQARCIALLGNRYRGGIWADVRDTLRLLHLRNVTDADTDTFYINCTNGLLDWKTMSFMPHTPDVFNFNQITVAWQPDATSPVFDAWAKEVFGDDAHISLALEIMGYCLLNDLPIQKAFVLTHGEGAPSGRNGKGTYLKVIEAMLGRDNVTTVQPQDFGVDKWAAASLYGRLANLAGDVSAQPFKNAATFKSLTGQDTIRADVKNKEPIMFRNRATIVASFNELPSSLDRSTGFLSRWVALPFYGDYSGTKADLTMESKLLAELPGILRQAVEGLRRVMARGYFIESTGGLEVMDNFRRSVDHVRQFLTDLHDEPENVDVQMCPGFVPASGEWVCSLLHRVYVQWCVEQGVKVSLGRTKFSGSVQAASDTPWGPLRKIKRRHGWVLTTASE